MGSLTTMHFILVVSFIGFAAAQCPTNLSPCTCVESGPDISNATLDCSAVVNQEGLLGITELQTGQPIKFATIVIAENPTITSIPAKAFGRAYADEYVFTNNQNLAVIESGFMNNKADPQLINLSRNKISNFPFQDLKKLTKLQYFVLQNNEIPEIPAGAFDGVATNTLNDIILNNNKISVIGKDAFAGERTQTNAIVISNNELSKLESGALCLHSKPQFLVLNNNQLTNIAADAFTCTKPKGASFAKATVLAHNLFKSIPKTEFESFITELAKLPAADAVAVDFEGNELICDCKLYWLTQVANGDQVVKNAVCSQPPPAKGKSIFAFDFTALNCQA